MASRAAPELRPPAVDVRHLPDRAVQPTASLRTHRAAMQAYRAAWRLCHAPTLLGWVAPLDLSA